MGRIFKAANHFTPFPALLHSVKNAEIAQRSLYSTCFFPLKIPRKQAILTDGRGCCSLGLVGFWLTKPMTEEKVQLQHFKVKEGDSSLLLCSCETPSAVLHPGLMCSAQEGHEPAGMSREGNHENHQRDGAPFL